MAWFIKVGEDTSNIFSDIEQKPFFTRCRFNLDLDICDPENKVKVTRVELSLCLTLVILCTKCGEDASNISSDIQRNHLSHAVTLKRPP